MRNWVAALLLMAAPLRAGPAIDVNQTGFAPGASRIALLRGGPDAPAAWVLRDGAGREVLRGEAKPLGMDRYAGQTLQRIDFSGKAPAGQGYRLEAAGAVSPPFAIAPALYAPVARDALRYFYHQRSGVPIEARFAGERWARPAGHPSERVTCYAGKDERGNLWPGCDHELDATGGWYDAGDHGKYVVNGGISLWTLQNLGETLPASFADGSLGIPQSGNRIADLLDEARHEMEWMLSMQAPQGARMKLPVNQPDPSRPLTFTEVDVGGMAHHKLADEHWTGLPLRPDQDRERRFLYPPSTAATLNLAATAAQCARIWRTIDPAFSARCLTAAERAWDAALRNPAIFATWSFNGSGGYGDADVADEFYWAAAELFATTGKPIYRDVVTHNAHFANIGAEPGWASVAPLGTLTLAFAPNGLAEADQRRLRDAIITAADRWKAESASVGYRIPYASQRYPWGSNANLLNRAMVLAAAHRLTGKAGYREAVLDVADYLLGRNPMGTSYVSGHGARAANAMHHRFWANSIDPAFPPPPPGVLSGGPNNSAMSDDVAKAMQGKCAPQTCWVDDIRAFALNETAINWNAPLAWVMGWLAATEPSA